MRSSKLYEGISSYAKTLGESLSWLQIPQAALHTSTSTPSPLSSVTSASSDQSMMVDTEMSADPGSSEVPRIFALVVSIDEYKNPELKNLTGCKNDGRRFIDFLTGVLGVPSSHIVFLADREATQQQILDQFNRFLIRNTDIQQNDAIIFYFSGHGSRPDAPTGWVTENNKIETLCPHDVYTLTEDQQEVWGIPDRTINKMLRHLASEKGDNIVAVFDCCNSGGLSRAVASDLRIRYIPPPDHPPPADLDREVWSSIPDPEPGSRAAKNVIQPGFRYKAMASHVLLAACRPDEFAMENPAARDGPGGLFTSALVECLRCCGLHDTTYAKLFEMIDLKQKNQHPQCEGINKNRLLFSVNAIRDGETTFRVYRKGGKLYVSAGSIHGIVVGTEFTVRYFAQELVLKAKTVDAFETILEGSNRTITKGSAVVSRWHQSTLKVYSSTQHSSAHVTDVPNRETADVTLHQVGLGKWTLERLDPLIPVYSDRFFQFDADARRKEDVLNAIANFSSYLYRPSGGAGGFADKVTTRLRCIGTVGKELGPVGADFLDVPPSSLSGVNFREATITDLDGQYSLTLENHSDVDLFPYLFYFDPSDYSIQAWYIPPAPTTAPPLKRRRSDGAPSLFAFGYGGFGTDPIEFYLPPGHATDSGFLRVFLTTTYVDMTHVAQPGIHEIGSARWMTNNALRKGSWACETFVLTCRRS